MGRFSHEALHDRSRRPATSTRPRTPATAGFYKFVPYRRGQLEEGGALYMLAVANQPNVDLGLSLPIGTTWDVEWVRIDDPLAATQSCYAQGAAKGGARFSRLEGAWWGHRTGYFLSTNGGTRRRGPGVRVQPAKTRR